MLLQINEISAVATIFPQSSPLGEIFIKKMSCYAIFSFKPLEPLLKKLGNLPECSGKGTMSSTVMSRTSKTI